ncbi:hypothetical protein MKW92_015079 [Papaver armeniacum]|nr:hypothetical protein MKW92_015079 [Papaver armeniacum]
MNFVQRKIYLYNVTFGLYMLEWWERYLFNILFLDIYKLIIVLLWFVCYNGSRAAHLGFQKNGRTLEWECPQ